MIIVGIDMSKNSPGVCVREGDKLTFLSFIRGEEESEGKRMSKGRKRVIDHFAMLRSKGVKIISNNRSTKVKEYTDLEVWKVMDASLLAETIVSALPDNVDMVGIEGFSYGSKGNSGLDIAGYAYCVRKALFEKYGMEKLCVFSPGNVKKTAGKGNAGKEEIMNFFLQSKEQDLNANPLWMGLSTGEITTEKPIDDLVDSYYVQECTKNHYESRMKVTISN
jgi:hypothetical protein